MVHYTELLVLKTPKQDWDRNNMMGKVCTTNVSELEYMDFQYSPKTLRSHISESCFFFDRRAQYWSFEQRKINTTTHFATKIKKCCHIQERFWLIQKRTYCAFYRIDPDPPDRGFRQLNMTKNVNASIKL